MESAPGPVQVRPQHPWETVAQDVVDDAYAVLGYRFILLSRFDRLAGVTQPVAWGGRYTQSIQRTSEMIRRVLPNFDAWDSTFRHDRNPHLHAVWSGGETVTASLAELTAGLVPPIVATVSGQVAGARHAAVVPLRAGGVSIGSLTCFQRGPAFTEQQLRMTQAYARQVALSIQNAELAEEQRRTAAALDASRQLLSQAEERTRRSISEFLHSQVQSKLLVAWYKLGEIPTLNDDARQRLEVIRQDLEYLREHDVRRLSHLLHPEGLSLGLVASVQVLLSRLPAALCVQIVTDEALTQLDAPGPAGLPMPLRLGLFRTVEEALNNILKHARARQVTIWITAEGQTLSLEITDDGQGFDVTCAPPGLGLLCLGARVEALGGQWGIDSRPGGPTRLWAGWPR